MWHIMLFLIKGIKIIFRVSYFAVFEVLGLFRTPITLTAYDRTVWNVYLKDLLKLKTSFWNVIGTL